MSFVNICRDNTDPFYRYKMPLIQAKTEGRGNGIKTAVLNLPDVARALNRPTIYVLKYFGFELGAQTSQERSLVNGVHEASKLQDCLDGFINKFVLCGSCKNPETDIIIEKDGTLTRDCKACGSKTKIDPRHKLATYIEKNPPESAKSKKNRKAATASANVVGGGVSISDIASGQKSTDADATPVDDDDDIDELARKINAEASALPEVQEVADDEWAVDMSEEAIRKRAQELEGLTVNEELSALDEFGEWLLGFDKSELPSDVDIYKRASDLDIVEDEKILQVLAQALFDEDILDQIPEHKGLLGKLITNENAEKSLLGGIERLVGLQFTGLIPSVPKIVMILYDEDLVSESVIQDWGTHVSKKFVPKDVSKKVRKAAKPFLKWLEEAEEEDSD
ncbi:BA75_04542T0 [Komagataella pastoris]|uniref:BA75_04542T0 n=1 Tax=Komagataella pastoris TaxID=4922 RepID=A0A1B2JJ38_PICPA|nr:BA75_04542T0 [Komagataella pastoris]